MQEFKALNIFYGRNYSGKTTLSRILRSFELKTMHPDYTNTTFEIQRNDGNLTENNIQDETTNLNIRVYNKDFVKDNLGFLIDDKKGDIKAFASVIMGKENKEIQTKIQELQNNLGNEEDKESNILASGLHKELQDLEKEKADILEQMQHINQDEKLRKKAKEIKENSNFLKQGENYTITEIKKDIEKIKDNTPQYILSQDDKDKYSNIIKDEPKNPINFLLPFEQDKFSQIINQAKELVERQIIAKENIENDLRKWLDQGLKLHEHDNEKCKFCENPLSQERIQWLIENIRDESKDKIDLENGLKEWLEGFEDCKIKIDVILQSIERDNFCAESKEYFNKLKESLNKNIEKYNKELESIKKQILSKQDNIFGDFKFDYSKTTDFSQDIQTDLEAIKNLCEKK